MIIKYGTHFQVCNQNPKFDWVANGAQSNLLLKMTKNIVTIIDTFILFTMREL